MTTALLLALALNARAATSAEKSAAPDERAAAIARAQPRVASQLAALKNEAAAVKDPARREDLREILERRRLIVLSRRPDEAAVLKALKAEKLVDDSASALFPPEPLAFEAAPGGVWHGHHSYPGGLVDHTLFNLRAGLGLAAAYRSTYGVPVDEDAVREAAILHDAAKPATLRWNADGSLPASEPQVAGTGLHHILGIAEALSRGWPPRLVVCVASAHNPPKPGAELSHLLDYLRAAAIVAGKTNAAAGLTADGKALAAPAPLEAFITHLDDHDWVLTETTIQAADKSMGSVEPWTRDEALAKTGDVPLYVQGAK